MMAGVHWFSYVPCGPASLNPSVGDYLYIPLETFTAGQEVQVCRQVATKEL